MIIVDKALAEREASNRPIRIGLVGAGFAGKGFALQILGGLPGLRLVAIYNRTIEEAKIACQQADVTDFRQVGSVKEMSAAAAEGRVAVTDAVELLTDSDDIDVIVEATGEIDFAAATCMRAFAAGKHAVVLNAELDATLGPILKVKADAAGVMYCQADGDQPAVIMNLFRYVKSIGFEPVLCGNIKSLQDCRRTPTTQAEFARNVWQRPKFITSFADGTKISQEMATVANATGFGVARRGMAGPRCTHVDDAPKLFDCDSLRTGGGIVDYILGAQPSFGVFVIGHTDKTFKQRYMKCYKMGDGPYYTFYTPFHLSPIEAPNSVARAVLFNDAPVVSAAGPVCDVITIAKRDLKAGEKLDGIGGYLSYGTMENTPVALAENLLPMGLSEGCVLKRDLPTDAAVTFDDVSIPPGRVSDALYAEQLKYFKLRRASRAASAVVAV